MESKKAPLNASKSLMLSVSFGLVSHTKAKPAQTAKMGTKYTIYAGKSIDGVEGAKIAYFCGKM